VAGLEDGALGRLGYRAVLKGRYDPAEIVEQIRNSARPATASEDVFIRMAERGCCL
jgi:hypothetical protein